MTLLEELGGLRPFLIGFAFGSSLGLLIGITIVIFVGAH